MAKINFTCTQCGRILNLPAEYAGRLVKCPHCGHSSAVPFPSTRRTRQQPTVPTQDVDAEVVSTTSASLWPALGYPFRRGGFVIVLILAAGLLLARAFIYLSSFSYSSFRHVAGTYTLDIFAVGYLCLYAITILKSCANGQDDLPYLQVCSFFFLLFYLNAVLPQYLSSLGVPGLIIRLLLSVYLAIVALRILGLTYLRNARQLNWDV
jgi:predicted RNA-binding Zn-ribbon protein involved in translation (DUF1610 family)